MKPIYFHEPDGTTICTLRDNFGNTVQGMARLHPDEPHASDFTGEYISTIRAEIKYYKLIRKNELGPQIKTLNHLLNCITNTGSKRYNPDSPEAKLIRKQYWMAKTDYEAVGEIIEQLENALSNYIKARSELIGQNKVN